MTTTQFILIILAVMAIVFGILMVVRALRKNTTNEHLPPSDMPTEQLEQQKDGIPIVPRHERPEPIIAETASMTETAITPSASFAENFSQQKVIEEPSLTATQHTETSPETSFETSRQKAMEADNFSTNLNASTTTTDTVYSIEKTPSPLSSAGSPADLSHETPTQTNVPDAFSALVNATQTLTPVVQTYDESQLKADVFSENSPILDTHIQAQIDQEQNSPLNNAEQNINISLFPNSQFDRIVGKDLLSLVDKYGLKYGAMNMFHRYENKDGTGLLWFSMMQVDDEGVSPFDLNKLPLQSLKGLVLFLSLPHPKAVQGFDSMMSIAGLLAQDLGASLYDHDGEPISRDSVQYMREMAMDYGIRRND